MMIKLLAASALLCASLVFSPAPAKAASEGARQATQTVQHDEISARRYYRRHYRPHRYYRPHRHYRSYRYYRPYRYHHRPRYYQRPYRTYRHYRYY